MAKDKHVINVQFPHSVWPQVLEAVEESKNVPCPHCGAVNHNGGRFGVATWIRDLVLAELARIDTAKKRKKPGRKPGKKKSKRGPGRPRKKKEPEPVVVSSMDEPYAIPLHRS